MYGHNAGQPVSSLYTTVLSDQLSVLILSEIKPFNDKHASEHLDLHRQQSVADVAF